MVNEREDAGLAFNRLYQKEMFKPGELIQIHTFAPNGQELWIEIDYRFDLYRLAFGSNPRYPQETLTKEQAMDEIMKRLQVKLEIGA